MDFMDHLISKIDEIIGKLSSLEEMVYDVTTTVKKMSGDDSSKSPDFKTTTRFATTTQFESPPHELSHPVDTLKQHQALTPDQRKRPLGPTNMYRSANSPAASRPSRSANSPTIDGVASAMVKSRQKSPPSLKSTSKPSSTENDMKSYSNPAPVSSSPSLSISSSALIKSSKPTSTIINAKINDNVNNNNNNTNNITHNISHNNTNTHNNNNNKTSYNSNIKNNTNNSNSNNINIGTHSNMKKKESFSANKNSNIESLTVSSSSDNRLIRSFPNDEDKNNGNRSINNNKINAPPVSKPAKNPFFNDDDDDLQFDED